MSTALVYPYNHPCITVISTGRFRHPAIHSMRTSMDIVLGGQQRVTNLNRFFRLFLQDLNRYIIIFFTDNEMAAMHQLAK